MPQPKSVKIAGVEIKEVQDVSLSVSTPVGSRGDYEGRTTAPTLRLVRRARNTPTKAMFENATNKDGRQNYITGTVVLQNNKLEETFTIEIKSGFIAGWEFEQPPGDDHLSEIITIKIGEMDLKGGGGSKSFKMPEWLRA
ncbi:MAG: hypothetical protein EPO24_03260 [Bacteroidetes bacterium]|nr:MAG: hypothetical protein EPO24_03260 [Bacteroidota bacterium]